MTRVTTQSPQHGARRAVGAMEGFSDGAVFGIPSAGKTPTWSRNRRSDDLASVRPAHLQLSWRAGAEGQPFHLTDGKETTGGHSAARGRTA